eukprot:5939361-Amphidinium_carterae.1
MEKSPKTPLSVGSSQGSGQKAKTLHVPSAAVWLISSPPLLLALNFGHGAHQTIPSSGALG